MKSGLDEPNRGFAARSLWSHAAVLVCALLMAVLTFPRALSAAEKQTMQVSASVDEIKTQSGGAVKSITMCCHECAAEATTPLEVTIVPFSTWADSVPEARIAKEWPAVKAAIEKVEPLSDFEKLWPGEKGIRYFMALQFSPSAFRSAANQLNDNSLARMTAFQHASMKGKLDLHPGETAGAYIMLMQFHAADSAAKCPSIAQKVERTTTLTYQFGTNKPQTNTYSPDPFVEFTATADADPKKASDNKSLALDFHSAVMLYNKSDPIKDGDHTVQASEVTEFKSVAKYTACGSKKQVKDNYLLTENADMECIQGTEIKYTITFEVWKSGAGRLTIAGIEKEPVVYASKNPAPPSP